MSYFKKIILKFIDRLLRILSGKGKYVRTLFVKELREGNSVYLKTPKDIPQKVLDDFSVLFKKYPVIILAYLAEGFLEVKEDPHCIVGLELDEQSSITIEQLMDVMAKELNELIPRGFYVDFIELREQKAPINSFMKDYLIPFYKK